MSISFGSKINFILYVNPVENLLGGVTEENDWDVLPGMWK